MAQRLPEETLHAFVRRHWCVWGPDGAEDTDRITRVLDTLARQDPDLETRREIDCPDEVSQIPEVVRRYLPEVEADPRLLALSFVDPLRLANDHLGIAVSPRVARAVRRGLRGMVSFDLSSLDPGGRLRGIEAISWRPVMDAGTGQG
jgi:hypothetical protein